MLPTSSTLYGNQKQPLKNGGFPASYVRENQRVLLGGSSQLVFVNNHGGRKSPKDRVIPIPNGRISWLINGG